MAERNPYEVLGVGRQASDGEIKRAFRKLARQHHPDRNQGDAAAEAKFKEVQSAYEAIGTSEARREYDQQEQMRNMFGGRGRGRGGPSMNFGGMGGGRRHHRANVWRRWVHGRHAASAPSTGAPPAAKSGPDQRRP